tara:strand:- start:1806 stop:2102 length:297 start_codon:yes stop_codon:yes gene_type:complete
MNDNKLIAEFMGHEPIVKGDDVYYELNEIRLTSADDLRYHTSWDWLMPVVEKIMWDNDIEDNQCTNIADALCDAKIDRVYEAVVDFIREYNLTPKEVV